MALRGRRLARRCAVQALYQWRLTGQPRAQIKERFIADENLTGAAFDYFLELITQIPAHVDELDALIAAQSERDADSMDWLAQAIVRLGAFELAFAPSVPTKTVIDEAVTLAKLFCAEHAYKYINAVLDRVARAVRDDFD